MDPEGRPHFRQSDNVDRSRVSQAVVRKLERIPEASQFANSLGPSG
jgi:hypothetical protein